MGRCGLVGQSYICALSPPRVMLCCFGGCVQRLAKWDVTRWSKLGQGFHGYVVPALMVLGTTPVRAVSLPTAGGLPATTSPSGTEAVGRGVAGFDAHGPLRLRDRVGGFGHRGVCGGGDRRSHVVNY